MTPRMLAVLVLAVFAVIPCLLAVYTGSLIFLFGALLAPLFAFFFNRPDLLVVLICWLFYSSIRLPGLPGGRQVYELLMAAFFVVFFLSRLVSRPQRARSWSKVWAFLFLAVLLVTMAVRGAGFQSIGGIKWGGGRYLGLIPCILFFLASDSINLSPRQWRIAVAGMMLMALLPGLGELLFSLAGRAMVWQYFIFKPTLTAIQMPEMGEEISRVRFVGFIPGTFVFLLPFFLFPRRGPYLLAYAFFICLSLTLIGLTGHRLNLVILTLFLWFYFWFATRNKWRYLFVSLALALAVMAFLGSVARFLPPNFQRVLAIIPYASVSPHVYLDAQGTSRWRILVWREALKDIPRYLWLGKGYAYEGDAFISAMRNSSRSDYHNIVWALVSGSYHQGILSLLLGLGIPGLAAGLGFLASVLRRQFRAMARPWSDPGLRQIHYALFVAALVMSVTYLAIYGDAFVSLPDVFFFAALLEGLQRRQEQVPPTPPADGDESPRTVASRAFA